MTGRIVSMPPRPHPCGPPAGDWPTYTRWDCDDCGQRWMYTPPMMFEDEAPRDERWWARWDYDHAEPDLPDPGQAETTDTIGGAFFLIVALLAAIALIVMVATR